jgi:hypothetical protein
VPSGLGGTRSPPLPAAEIVGFAIAYADRSHPPRLVTLHPGGRIGEQRALGFSPTVAVGPLGVLVADMDPSAAIGSKGRVRLYPITGAGPTWERLAVQPPIRVDGLSAPLSGVAAADSLLFEAAPPSGPAYDYKLVEIGASGPTREILPLPGCGVATLVRVADRGQTAIQCGSGSDLIVLVDSADVSRVHVAIGASITGFAAGPTDATVVIAADDGSIAVADLNGAVRSRWSIPGGLHSPFGAITARAASVVVGVGQPSTASQGTFDRVISFDGAGHADQWDLAKAGSSLVFSSVGLWVADRDGCVDLYSLPSHELLDQWCNLGLLARVVPMP